LLGDFFTYRGGKRRGKTKKGQCTHRVNSNLPVGALPGRPVCTQHPGRERVLLFVNRKSPPFAKSNTRKEKAIDLSACGHAQVEKHNTPKIIQI